MAEENIDYENLKQRGFLRQKQEGFFVLRTRMSSGIYKPEGLERLAEIAKRYGKGLVHATTRQGLEIPFIKLEDIPKVEDELRAVGIEAGTSGACLRTTTLCPGNNWCKQGLIDTFLLSERIEKELNIKCGLGLPHKFKIAISGCPNGCTRPQAAEIGIHGQVDLKSEDKRIGYCIYLGGCAGRTPRAGFRLDKVFTEDEVLKIVDTVVRFFKNNAKTKQRLALLIEELGREKFLKEVG